MAERLRVWTQRETYIGHEISALTDAIVLFATQSRASLTKHIKHDSLLRCLFYFQQQLADHIHSFSTAAGKIMSGYWTASLSNPSFQIHKKTLPKHTPVFAALVLGPSFKAQAVQIMFPSGLFDCRCRTLTCHKAVLYCYSFIFHLPPVTSWFYSVAAVKTSSGEPSSQPVPIFTAGLCFIGQHSYILTK